MKTYRLYSLRILVGEEKGIVQKNIPIEDGLIINMEDDKKNWLIDAVIENSNKELFTNLFTNKETFIVEAVITSKNNYPATMSATVRKIIDLSGKIGVLLDGILVINKDDIVETILKAIVNEGLTGEDLLNEFKRRKDERDEAVPKVIEDLFNDIAKQEKAKE